MSILAYGLNSRPFGTQGARIGRQSKCSARANPRYSENPEAAIVSTCNRTELYAPPETIALKTWKTGYLIAVTCI